MHATSRSEIKLSCSTTKSVRLSRRQGTLDPLLNRNRKRLLHPGADTKLILQQYVATIKCLRMIDPPGVLLFKVAEPIRRYLRLLNTRLICVDFLSFYLQRSSRYNSKY